MSNRFILNEVSYHGTAAEVTINYVITDEEKNRKWYV